MNILLFSQSVLLAIVLKSPGDVDGQLTVPSSPTCPGNAFTFDCTVMRMSGMNAVILWRVNDTTNLCTISQISTNTDDCGPNDAFTGSPGRVTATSFQSTLSGTADPELDGLLVECFGPVNNVQNMDNKVGESPIQIVGPPAVNLSCVNLSEAVNGSVSVTVSWTLIGGDSADFYLINITCTNAPQLPSGGFVNTTNASVTQYELTGFLSGFDYNIVVRGVTTNCGGLVGRASEPLRITPRVPRVSVDCNLTLSYNQSPGKLLSIFSTWISVPDPIDPDPGDLCPGPSGNVTQYRINFQAESSTVNTFIVNSTMCKARTCNYTFEPPLNPPSSYDRVSVAAENVVGVGAARNLTTQPIDTTNNLLTGDVVDVSLPDNVKINCTFLSGFTGSSHCTVQYGTDPTYMNLPYSASSTENGTTGDSVSVVLRERLNSSTVYYYNVSAVSGDLTVVVLASPFMTGCFLDELWNLPAPATIFRNDVSLLNDSATQYPSCDDGSVGSAVLVNTTLNTATVAYYTGTTPGSTACFVCNNASGYAPNTTISNERVCQNDGRWSRTPVVCGCSLRELWNLPAADATFLPDVTLLNDSAQYPSCDDGSVGSVVLRNNRHNTATVAYYGGTTPGSRACFICDKSSGYAPNTTTTERVCQNDATWSGSPIICESSSNVGAIVGGVVGGGVGVVAVGVIIVVVYRKRKKIGNWPLIGKTGFWKFDEKNSNKEVN